MDGDLRYQQNPGFLLFVPDEHVPSFQISSFGKGVFGVCLNTAMFPEDPRRATLRDRAEVREAIYI